MTDMHYYTDYEAALIYLTAVRHDLAAPSRALIASFPEHLRRRHGPGSIALRWTDFRTAVNPDLKPTRGAHLPQVKRIIRELQPVTGVSLRDDLAVPQAA